MPNRRKLSIAFATPDAKYDFNCYLSLNFDLVNCEKREISWNPKKSFLNNRAKIWKEMPASLRELPKKHLQTKVHSFLLDILKKHDDYIGIY